MKKCPEFPSLVNRDIVKQTETFKISEVKGFAHAEQLDKNFDRHVSFRQH